MQCGGSLCGPEKGCDGKLEWASVDINTALLNAPLPGGKGEDHEDLETTVLLWPPSILVQLG